MTVMIQVGILGCDTMQCCGRIPLFQGIILPPSSGWSGYWDRKQMG